MSDPDPTDVIPTIIPPTTPMMSVGNGSDLQVVDDSLAGVPGSAVEDVAQHHGRRADQQGGAQGNLHVVLGCLGVTQEMEHVRSGECGRYRPDHHPCHQAEVDGPLSEVDGRPDGPHHHCGHEVARNGRGGRHEGAASRTGHPDQEADDGAAQHDVGIQPTTTLVSMPRRGAPSLPIARAYSNGLRTPYPSAPAMRCNRPAPGKARQSGQRSRAMAVRSRRRRYRVESTIASNWPDRAAR
jgi:hypothetical protein